MSRACTDLSFCAFLMRSILHLKFSLWPPKSGSSATGASSRSPARRMWATFFSEPVFSSAEVGGTAAVPRTNRIAATKLAVRLIMTCLHQETAHHERERMEKVKGEAPCCDRLRGNRVIGPGV